MASDEKEKKWGTIFLDAAREATLGKLDDMQAASRQEQWNQRTQNDYLEKVRAKATERAREILGEAYTERQRVLEEAKEDGRRIRLEAQVEFAKAEETLAEAKQVREAAQHELDQAAAVHSASKEDGFNAGLHQAQQELEAFRAAMGSSVAGVLKAIETQCMGIFEGWREEMTALLKVCVEKSTGLVLDEQYQLILEHLVLEAVRQLDDRRIVTLRVHPDDEAAVADMFAAAKERMPNIGQWMVTADPSLELGGLIAESQSGSVDSRLELFQALVANILEHLTLPGSSLDNAALSAVEEAVRQEAAHIAAVAPPLPQAEVAPEDLPEVALLPEDHAAAPDPELAEPALAEMAAQATPPPPAPQPGAAPEASALPDATSFTTALDDASVAEALTKAQNQLLDASEAAQAEIPAPEPVLTPEAAPPTATAQTPTPQAGPAHEPTLEELEEELLPIPPQQQTQSLHQPSPLDAVLAGGGFLDPVPATWGDKAEDKA